MIISVNSKPSISQFSELMSKTDILLNYDAQQRPKYYAERGGNPLEDDVKAALDECAKGTPFENTIEKISGHRFPDIVAAKYYGVEVKSTKSNHWTSTGSSILETTRVSDVERIFMTFGKLGGNPIEFISRPYEACLSDIAVTHMPRYLIDMNLKPGQTIFDKIGISYDELRQMDNPIAPVSKYYRSKLKPGESLWWTGDSNNEVVSAKIRLWNTLDKAEKDFFTVNGCVRFPEIFRGLYDRYALWLTSQGIVDPHIRDQFSAGGKESYCLADGSVCILPAVFRRIHKNQSLIVQTLCSMEPEVKTSEQVNERVQKWISDVLRYVKKDDRNLVYAFLTDVFNI